MLKKILSVIGAYKLYEKWLWLQVKNGAKLEHIAIILDGNRRWASENKLNPWLGHKKGAETVEQLLDWCEKLGVKFVTLYAFSTENFRRSPEEVAEIMEIAEEEFRKLLTDERIQRDKVHVKVIGRVNLLPESLQQLIVDVEKTTEDYDNRFLNFAFAYGGRAEILDAAPFSGELQIRQNLEPVIASEQKITEDMIETWPELADFTGGIKITVNNKIPATLEELEARLADLRFKPDTQNLNWYPCKILSTELDPIEPNSAVQSFVYVSAEPEAAFRELEEDEWNRFVDNEETKVISAASLEASLPRITQIDPSVGAEAKTRALIAIILSLFAIVAYIWVRFGDVRYGVAAIAALVHDVCITVGAVTGCTYIAFTAVGEKLLIGDFKIDLAMIAALLTLIGYSLNDTIVVFDRIRENRRKGRLDANIITNSINQTLSRTLLTSFTTFIVVLVMYIFGGTGLRGFTFAIGFGIIIGTYSSIAIAAPLLLLHMPGVKKTGTNKNP